jgi:hypothetical protein
MEVLGQSLYRDFARTSTFNANRGACVLPAAAQLSENKKNVYSEFSVVVEKVFKTPSNSIVEGTAIIVDRTGGFVRYLNRHTVLSVEFSSENMPLVGERYPFLPYLEKRARHFNSDGV